MQYNKNKLIGKPAFWICFEIWYNKYMGGDNMTNNELCILLDSLLALLETDNSPRAIAVIKNAIQRIDKNSPDNVEPESTDNEPNKK